MPKQNYWLFDQLHVVDPERRPRFAMLGMINWMKAVCGEITAEHGAAVNDQLDSCRNWYATHVGPKPGAAPLADIFEPLFHSLTFSTAVVCFHAREACSPWIFPTAIISWYYAVYHGMRSILGAWTTIPTETHSATIKAVRQKALRESLPHPLNMVATRITGDKYKPSLPNCPDTTPYDLSKTFTGNRDESRGMLLQYLNGTAEFENLKPKEILRKQLAVTEFRTKEAKEERDKVLVDDVNFMSCAYRYRGKANYRDAIFLTYGQNNSILSPDYISSLGTVAKFCFVAALAYAERRIGSSDVRAFMDDVKTHVRGQATGSSAELFWQEISL